LNYKVPQVVLKDISAHAHTLLKSISSNCNVLDKDIVVFHVTTTESYLQPLFSSGTVHHQIVEHGTTYTLDTVQIIGKKPRGKYPVPWHQDSPVNMVSYWIPLCDVDQLTGALHLKPCDPSTTPIFPTQAAEGNLGTTLNYEKIGTSLADFEQDAVCVEMKAGEILKFYGSTPHLSNPNSGETWRLVLILRFISDSPMFMEGKDVESSLYGNVMGFEFSENELVPTISSPVFNGGRHHRHGHHGHGQGHRAQLEAQVNQQQQQLQKQAAQQQALTQQINTLLQENQNLQARVSTLNTQNQGHVAEIQQIRQRSTEIRGILAGLGINLQ